jgi:polyphosphate glucokinase
VLVVDVGGTSVKILATGQHEHRSFASGPKLTPSQMVSGVKKLARDWSYDVVSVGYPARFSTVGRLLNRTTSGADGSGSISQLHSAVS